MKGAMPFDVAERERQLGEFYPVLGLGDEADACERRLALIAE